MDYNVKDSSIYYHPKDQILNHRSDGTVCVGIVRGYDIETSGTIYYKVEIFKDGVHSIVSCLLLNKFGGPHNYEEYTLRPYHKDNTAVPESDVSTLSYKFKAGDVVVVAGLNGDWREAVILGCLSHPSRESNLELGTTLFRSSFNGLDTVIGDDGTYKILWNGKPVNDSVLDTPPEVTIGTPPPAPEYDPTTTGTFFGIDINGSFTISDGKEEMPQLIKIKKQTGNISIVSGTNRIEIGASDVSGKPDSIALKAGNIAAGAETVDIGATDALKISATSAVSVKGETVSIGNDTIELIDGLVQLIDAIGSLVISSPVGPCGPVMGAPQWSQIDKLKQDLSTLMGSLEQAEDISAAEVTDTDNFTV